MKKSIFLSFNKKMFFSVLLVSGIVAVGCGGSESSGVINNPGTGSQTLKIDATISAKENFAEAKNIDDFTVDITIKVWDAQDQPVSDASVKVNNLLIPPKKNGQYSAGSILVYDRVYTITIVRDTDSVEGVTVTGPEIHTLKIGNPQDTPTTVKASSPVSVLWSPYGYATSAEIETKNFKETVADSGNYTIPAGNFESGVDDYIRVTREKSLNPAGAVAGSIVTVKIRNRLDPIKVVE